MKSILIGCNNLTSLNSLVYPHHCKFWYRLGRNHREYSHIFYSPRRVSIDNMRNESAHQALANGCEYLFFYDDDVIFDYNTLELLIETAINRKASIVGGLTYVRSYPFKSMIYRYKGLGDEKYLEQLTGDNIKNVIKTEGDIIWSDAIGFSCCLIDCRILKELEKPYFITGSINTEDIYFCVRLKDYLPSEKIICNTKVKVKHLVDPYWIDHDIRDSIMSYEEKVLSKGTDVSGDRGKEYLDGVKDLLKIA